jgi:hypothetical protein
VKKWVTYQKKEEIRISKSMRRRASGGSLLSAKKAKRNQDAESSESSENETEKQQQLEDIARYSRAARERERELEELRERVRKQDEERLRLNASLRTALHGFNDDNEQEAQSSLMRTPR